MSRKGLGKYKAMMCQNGDKNCHYCGSELLFDIRKKTNPNFATVDHVKAVADGGRNRMSNFVLACCRCNSIKSNMSYDKYCAKVNSVETRDKFFNSIKDKTAKKKEMRRKETIVKLAHLFHVTNTNIVINEEEFV